MQHCILFVRELKTFIRLFHRLLCFVRAFVMLCLSVYDVTVISSAVQQFHHEISTRL